MRCSTPIPVEHSAVNPISVTIECSGKQVKRERAYLVTLVLSAPSSFLPLIDLRGKQCSVFVVVSMAVFFV